MKNYKLREYSKCLKVALVTGAKQVGKSTLLKHVFPELKTIVFDPHFFACPKFFSTIQFELSATPEYRRLGKGFSLVFVIEGKYGEVRKFGSSRVREF